MASEAPITDTHDTTANVSLPVADGTDPFDAADSVSRSGRDMVDGMVDVRDDAMNESEHEQFQSDLAARKSTQPVKTDPLKTAAPLQSAQQAAALALGKHQFTAEEAAKLEKVFDIVKDMPRGQALELLHNAMAGGNKLFSSINSSVEQKRQEAVAIRKQGMRELQEAQALKKQIEEISKRMGGAQPQGDPRAQAAQAQVAVPNLDPNDPFHAPLIPLYQTIQGLQQQLTAMQNHRDPYTMQQIGQGFQRLQQTMGDKFNDAVAKGMRQMGKQPNEYGEYDLNQLSDSEALVLQQGIVSHTEAVKNHGDQQDKWYTEATKDLSLFPKSRRANKQFWAQVVEDIENDVQAGPERFRQLALEMENELRSDVQSLATQQATVRDNAGVPIVSTAGAATSASVDGTNQDYDFKPKDGTDIFNHLGDQVQRRASGRTRR